MIRKIIKIDEEKCVGCGACANACHEGAIGMVDGKARLLREDYCDGLGDCLPACPVGAIAFEEREASAYDGETPLAENRKKAKGKEATGMQGEEKKAKRKEAAGTQDEEKKAKEKEAARMQAEEKKAKGKEDAGMQAEEKKAKRKEAAGMQAAGMQAEGREAAGGESARKETTGSLPCGCPGTASRAIRRDALDADLSPNRSRLSQWPVQIQLAPIHAPYLAGADLLVAADCTAYAYGNFHDDFIQGRITLIGCPKLDAADYAGKLAQIIAGNDIRSVTVVRMEVPCCGGIENAVRQALQESGKTIPWSIVTISTDGRILSRK